MADLVRIIVPELLIHIKYVEMEWINRYTSSDDNVPLYTLEYVLSSLATLSCSSAMGVTKKKHRDHTNTTNLETFVYFMH